MHWQNQNFSSERVLLFPHSMKISCYMNLLRDEVISGTWNTVFKDTFSSARYWGYLKDRHDRFSVTLQAAKSLVFCCLLNYLLVIEAVISTLIKSKHGNHSDWKICKEKSRLIRVITDESQSLPYKAKAYPPKKSGKEKFCEGVMQGIRAEHNSPVQQ